jgi:DNA polymerase-1
MKLLVLDGNSILNRAFYGIRLLTTKDGLFTNGIYGFLSILTKLKEDVKPDVTVVAFDLAAPTFRHKAYDGYKAGRKGMPDELRMQMPILKELLDKMGIVRLEAEGFEADDILGTEALAAVVRGDECVIATGDRDSLQLVNSGVTVLLASTKGGRPDTTIYDTAKIKEVYGIEPKQLIEVKALMGDTSDNIPGVAGIGEKTALDLIVKFDSVKNIYDNIETLDIKPNLKIKLVEGKQDAELSRELVEINCEVPVETQIEKLKAQPENAGLYRLLARLEFFSVIEKMGLRAPTAVLQEQAMESQLQRFEAMAVYKTDKLLERLKSEERADFCAVYDGANIAAAAFAFDDGILIALPEKTAGFDALIKALLIDECIEIRTHDIKKLYAYCTSKSIEPCGKAFDTMLAGYILNPSAASYEPTRLCDELKVSLPLIDIGFGLMEDVAACAKNALAVRFIADALLKQMRVNGQEKLFYEVELPLSKVLASMEAIGFNVDSAGISAYGEKLQARLEEMKKDIFEQTGFEFNINSPKQLGEVLFEKLGLPTSKRTKTGYSTNAEVLESLCGHHPIIEILLEYRKLSKLKSTYTDGLLKVIAPDGRIHSNFNQVETRTGRISSTEPNLQNIPVRSEAGRELRRFFIAREGWVLIDADYSQIELRILAHIANDEAMINAFNTHVDIHTLTASQVFNMPVQFVTPLMRSRAKAVNFGIVYGIGAFSLSQDISVSVKEADSYIKNYLDTFSGVRSYMEQVIKQAYEAGYVETLLGRRRMLPELASSNKNLRNFGERVARNTPIQGTAADIIKIAMVKVYDRLMSEGLKARLILQVHDELIVEAPEDETERASKILHEEMENAMQLSIKLEADVHCGRSWYDAKG